jgi:hypothetical protein
MGCDAGFVTTVAGYVTGEGQGYCCAPIPGYDASLGDSSSDMDAAADVAIDVARDVVE